MKNSLLKLSIVSVLTVGFMQLNSVANAQISTYPYVANFENSTTDPTSAAPSKSYASTDTMLVNGAKWVMPGVFLGTMDANDKKNGQKAARMRLTGGSTGDPSYMELAENLTNGVGTVTFSAGIYGASGVDSITLSYSNDNGATWTTVGSTPGLSTAALAAYTFNINQAGNVRIKLTKNNPANIRVNVDDITITSNGVAAPLTYITFTPTGNYIDPTTNEMSVTFSDPVTATSAAGYVRLYDLATNDVIDSFTATQGTINGATVTFPVTLANNADYAVTIDSGIYQGGSSLNSTLALGTWSFSTADTLPLPTMTGLQETFSTECDLTANILGVFRQTSLAGNSTWKCSTYGHGDNFSVSMNGGSSAGTSFENNDWLISRAKFDLSGFNAPELNLWQKVYYTGSATRKLKVSTNYDGISDPTDASFTWTEINVPAFEDSLNQSWNEITDIDLTPYKSTPFYMAFTYESGTTGAYEISYDDLWIKEKTTSVRNVNSTNVNLAVLGQASQNNIALEVATKAAEQVVVTVYDILGKAIYTTNATLVAGKNVINLDANIQAAGMYMINVNNANLNGTVKTFVK